VKLERLAALVESVSGIVFSAGQLVHLRELMARRAAQIGMTELAAYVLALEQGRLEEEWQVLLPAITVKESYLFRIPEQFTVLRERLLPELARARGGTPLRVWSAGCAHGEEPATLAVVLTEAGLPPSSWAILATDVDERALHQAAAGVFSSRAVSQVPPELLERHFVPRVGGWELDPALVARIHFARINLVREPLPALGPPFDLVFLRNVLIYFRPESQRRVVDAVANNLTPDGYLFLGHSESLWQLCDRLDPVDLGGCFAYRHAEPATAPQRQGGTAADSTGRAFSSSPSGPVRRPSGPILAPPAPSPATRPPTQPLTQAAAQTRAASPAAVPAPVEAAPPVGSVVEAIVANRPTDALQLAGRRAAARPEDAAAHALLGLVRDLADDGDGALTAYRAALFLRPGLYRVRFQLAERLRRSGWRDRAFAEYRRVLATLAEEGDELPELAALLPGDAAEVASRCRAALSRL
jgi:chemotaxis protein methyltransferase CheR